jgi:phosphoribosylglycinamide formyltransferase 1
VSRPALAVFASGNGTNLGALIDSVRGGTIDAEIRVVISDKKEAFALERARRAGIEALYLSPKEHPSRESYDLALCEAVRERNVDWIILAGFMRILSPLFVRAFSRRIVNIHPAILPKYPGTHAIERAFEAGEKEVGVTVHFVDEGVDTGPIIAQERILVRKGESLEELTERVHSLEHQIYPRVVADLVSGKIRLSGVSQ